MLNILQPITFVSFMTLTMAIMFASFLFSCFLFLATYKVANGQKVIQTNLPPYNIQLDFQTTWIFVMHKIIH